VIRVVGENENNMEDGFSNTYAMAKRLVVRRPHHSAEIRSKLKAKKIKDQEIKKAIHALKEDGLIDDVKWLEDYIYEVMSKKKYGPAYIKNNLRKRGISDDIDAVIEKYLCDNDITFDEIANEIKEKEMERRKGVPEEKAKAQLYRLLASRGFSHF